VKEINMGQKTEWQALREEYDAAWHEYENESHRIHAIYEDLDSGIQDQAPASEDLTLLQESWKRLETARQKLDDYMARQ
jgi:hypothetical protein